MSEYPTLKFRCSENMDEHIFELLKRRDFQELEVTKSQLLKCSVLLGLQILKNNPDLIQNINERDFVKGHNQN